MDTVGVKSLVEHGYEGRSLERVLFSRYFRFVHICNIRAIPTYRVYQLNDNYGNILYGDSGEIHNVVYVAQYCLI